MRFSIEQVSDLDWYYVVGDHWPLNVELIGTQNQMLDVASAIEERDLATFPRIGVDARGTSVELFTLKDDSVLVLNRQEAADLADNIRQTLEPVFEETDGAVERFFGDE